MWGLLWDRGWHVTAVWVSMLFQLLLLTAVAYSGLILAGDASGSVISFAVHLSER